ncbi:MAG: hypothetical protein GWP61_00805 [Chloroflexi bacterium]|jgi:hypothetical protein|nr:hypothetical protein [Chloroflexota bacterium]
MNFRNLMVVTAVSAIGFGVGFIILPAQLGSLFGMSSTPTSDLAFRLYATALIGIGVLTWLIRKADDYDNQKPILTGLLVTDFGGFLVMLYAQLAGVMNALGWTVTILLLLLSAAYAYLLFSLK